MVRDPRAQKHRGDDEWVGFVCHKNKRQWEDLMGASYHLKINYEYDGARLFLEIARDDSHKLQGGRFRVRHLENILHQVGGTTLRQTARGVVVSLSLNIWNILVLVQPAPRRAPWLVLAGVLLCVGGWITEPQRSLPTSDVHWSSGSKAQIHTITTDICLSYIQWVLTTWIVEICKNFNVQLLNLWMPTTILSA